MVTQTTFQVVCNSCNAKDQYQVDFERQTCSCCDGTTRVTIVCTSCWAEHVVRDHSF
jgi:hypothetical protein